MVARKSTTRGKQVHRRRDCDYGGAVRGWDDSERDCGAVRDDANGGELLPDGPCSAGLEGWGDGPRSCPASTAHKAAQPFTVDLPPYSWLTPSGAYRFRIRVSAVRADCWSGGRHCQLICTSECRKEGYSRVGA